MEVRTQKENFLISPAGLHLIKQSDLSSLIEGNNYTQKDVNGVLQEMMSQFSKTNKVSIMKSSQRENYPEKGRKTNIYKRRPMSVFDNNRVVTNYTMGNSKCIDPGINKTNAMAARVPFSQQNTIDKRRNTLHKQPFKDINKIQSKLEKNLYKLEMRSNVSPDMMYSDATTATASHDERRISIYLRALEEITKSNPETMGMLMYIRENLEKIFHSLIYK